MNTIWALFSIDNNHDQPNNNLVCWWPEKPTLEQVAEAMGLKFPASEDTNTMTVVNIWAGNEDPSTKGHVFDQTWWRLRRISSGVAEARF